MKKMPEINSGSMADISFLLLTFFLLTSSIDTDQGITRKLPPPPDPNADPPEVKERNVLKVLVNKSDRLLVQGQPIDIRQLKDRAKEFLTNPQNDPNLPEVEEVTINNLGTVRTTKGIISLKNDRGTSYDMYIQVQNELTAAINELRDELSQQRFGAKFADLTSTTQSEAVQKAIPIAISEAEPEDIGGKK
ncbi:MAG TPA: biopolymer transporter ExbD [Bacteroidales bacterium]|nr:biopolymer transporter ExbD [Bacteroidales bacterium]